MGICARASAFFSRYFFPFFFFCSFFKCGDLRMVCTQMAPKTTCATVLSNRDEMFLNLTCLTYFTASKLPSLVFHTIKVLPERALPHHFNFTTTTVYLTLKGNKNYK